MSRKIKRISIVIGIFAAAIGLVIMMLALRPEPPQRSPVDAAILVDTLPVAPTATRFEIRSQGTVAPRTETTLSAEVTGTIVEISPKFIAGGVFSAGETLMRIDPTNYRVAVRQAEALVKQRQIEFDGARRLRDQGYRAESEFAAAEAALASAEADLVRTRRDLERTAISLPYAGMVRRKNADLGQFVTPGTVLGVTFATDHAEVRLPLTDNDLAFIDLPAPGRAGNEESPGPAVELSAVREGRLRRWPASVVRTEGVVDEQSRVTFVVARIDDPYALEPGALEPGALEPGAPGARETGRSALPVGTFVTATIAGREQAGVIPVPRHAMRGPDQVWVADADDTLRARTVDVVRADDEFAYVSGGLEAGDEVVMTALEAPVNGLRVRTADTPRSTPDLDEESAPAFAGAQSDEAGDDAGRPTREPGESGNLGTARSRQR